MASVTPTVYRGKDIDPFNSFSLSCNAQKPDGIIPSLQFNWLHDGVRLDDSISTFAIYEDSMDMSSILNVTSAQTVNSGQYTCNVVLNIPESSAVMVSQSATVTITGKI